MTKTESEFKKLLDILARELLDIDSKVELLFHLNKRKGDALHELNIASGLSLIARLILVSTILLTFPFAAKCTPASQLEDPSLSNFVDSRECEAITQILTKKAANQVILDEDWKQMIASDGYQLLKRRAHGLGRDLNDDEFKGFVLSDSLTAQLQALTTSLEKLKKININKAVDRALAYLPDSTQVRARIYFLIKPTISSWVFKDSLSNASIGIYVDPTASTDQFKNTLVHELFHVGYDYNYFGSIKQQMFAHGTLTRARVQAFRMFGRLSEGFAMLAASGGADIHPHAVGRADERARWDADMRNFNSDLKRIDRFFVAIIDDKLTDDKIDQADSSFYAGYQGPWYTVGWNMAVIIEKAYGRTRLIQSIFDPKMLFSTYNDAALRLNLSQTEVLVLWSPSLIERMSK